jgi:nucleoside-diphosphate-sugar epimerase
MNGVVAVTGASGFIGRAVCRLLSSNGYRVHALVRSAARAEPLRPFVDTTVFGDIGDPDALERLACDSDAVVHCAGAVRGATQEAFDRVNVDGVATVVRVLSALKPAPRLLCLSSLAAREPGLSLYATSKRRGEEILEQQAGGLEWLALRPPAVYGPGDRELLPLFRLMARGFAPVPGALQARFSMIHVDDIAALVLAWLRGAGVRNGIYTLHDGRDGGYDWQEVADTVAAICARRVRLVAVPAGLLSLTAWINRRLALSFGYAPMLTPEKLRELRHPDWVCDNDAITAVLDWQPQLQLDQGLRSTPGWCAAI